MELALQPGLKRGSYEASDIAKGVNGGDSGGGADATEVGGWEGPENRLGRDDAGSNETKGHDRPSRREMGGEREAYGDP
jgi:hypothetical protein